MRVAVNHSRRARRRVREFLGTAFDYADLDYNEYLTIDDQLYRPSEVNILEGDASNALRKLNWSPETSFEELVQEMVESDMEWYSFAGTIPQK